VEEAVERQTGNIVDSPRTIAAVQEARLAFRIVGGEALESAHPGAPEVTRWRNRTVTEGDCALRAPYRWGESGSEQSSGRLAQRPAWARRLISSRALSTTTTEPVSRSGGSASMTAKRPSGATS